MLVLVAKGFSVRADQVSELYVNGSVVNLYMCSGQSYTLEPEEGEDAYACEERVRNMINQAQMETVCTQDEELGSYI